MTLSIPQHLAALENRLTSLGMVGVDVSLYGSSGDGYAKPWWIAVRYKFKDKGEQQDFNAKSEDTADLGFHTCVGLVHEHIDNLPTPEEAEHQEFLKLLARVVEKGRDVGIDDLVINPLVEAMKKLSENAITHDKSARF